MTNESLAKSYLRKASDRLDVLDVLLNKGAYSDVVREAQELVELALKGMLRAIGIEPPKLHDVGSLLLEHRERFSIDVQARLTDLADISRRLRKERELALSISSLPKNIQRMTLRKPGKKRSVSLKRRISLSTSKGDTPPLRRLGVR